MGYYKKSDVVCVDGGSYAAESTAGEMKKRGVDKENCEVLENTVTGIELIKFYELSGSVEYGMAVVLECTLVNGGKVKTTEDASKYLGWVQTHVVERGVMSGDFLFLFKGVIAELVERGGSRHTTFLDDYERQELKKQKVSKLDVRVGDVVNIHGKSIYLGEYYYYKPNLKTAGYVNQLRKYKLYIEQSADGSYVEGDLHVESGKTKYNQPTEILGNVSFDMGELVANAQERMSVIFKKDIGYRVTNGYGNYVKANDKENNKAYVLSNIAKDKEGVVYPYWEDLLRVGWLCGWDIDKKGLQYKKDRSGRSVEPYEYAVKQI